MRQLNACTQRGLTLVELMVALTIAALLAMAAAPWFADYGTNARLRESGNTLLTEALMAQSEAIKRNRVVRLATAGNFVTVSDMSDPANPVQLRSRMFAADVQAPTTSIDFSSSGWPTDFNAVSINLTHVTASCTADTRCPGLRIDGGGAVRFCGNTLTC
jgi:type IV fimbrial biogenesis protein FimT